MILVLASSGVRVGALNHLDWGDLEPVYRVGDRLTLDHGEESGELACAALKVYRGSSEAYTTFVTPEAFAALQEYGREWSEHAGRPAGPKDPMFISTRGVPVRVGYQTIHWRLSGVVRKSGLRDAGKEDRRYAVPLMNGFRRFYNKTCKEALSDDSTLGSLIKKEYMMGHRGLTSLDENYFKTDMLELAAEYVLAVPDLTIDDADRLRLSNRMISDNLRRSEGEKDEKMARMEKEMARLKREKDEAVERLEAEATRREAEAAGRERKKAEEAARSRRENSEEMARLREEVAELKKQGNVSVSDVLAALRNSDETEGISQEVVGALSGIMGQVGKAQDAKLREMDERHEAKMAKVMAVVDWMAKKSGLQYDLRAELAETAGDDEPPDAFPENPRDRGL